MAGHGWIHLEDAIGDDQGPIPAIDTGHISVGVPYPPNDRSAAGRSSGIRKCARVSAGDQVGRRAIRGRR
jgi:hypothetical protein